MSGRIPEAIAEVETALPTLERGWRAQAASACAILANAYMETGDLDAAERTLDQAAGAALHHGDHERAILAGARGRLRLLAGDAKGGLEDLTMCGELNSTADTVAALRWRIPAAMAAALLGDPGQALRLANQELHIARQIGTPRALGAALRAKGLVVGGADGLRLLEQSVDLLRQSSARLEHARALVDYGAALRRSGQRARARETLRDSLDLASRLGASALLEQADQELRASGAKPRRLAVTGLGSLTPAERRVAELAAAGLTNRQIAQSLFVTLKTVEGHLGHVYDKLSITSRSGLPAFMGHPTRTPAARG
jgi:ATP/maltotriose-dependent transcriptional regulator MalT